MNKLLFLSFLLFICSVSFGQSKRSIEISLIGRSDIHGNYVSNFAGRVYNDTNKISGFSYGVSGILRRKICKSYSLSFGIGYYQLRIDKIRGNIPFNIPGIRTGRNIDYDDGMTNLLYSTTQYHYNNLAFTFALDKEFLIKKSFKFNIVAEVIGYKTVSQKYRLLSGSNFYKTTNNKPLEYAMEIYSYYMCFKCNKPYFGGLKDCERALNEDSKAFD